MIDSYLKDNAFRAVKRDVNILTRNAKGLPYVQPRPKAGEKRPGDEVAICQ